MNYKIKVTTWFNKGTNFLTSEMEYNDFLDMVKNEKQIYLDNWFQSDKRLSFDYTFKLTKIKFNKTSGDLEEVEYSEVD